MIMTPVDIRLSIEDLRAVLSELDRLEKREPSGEIANIRQRLGLIEGRLTADNSEKGTTS